MPSGKPGSPKYDTAEFKRRLHKYAPHLEVLSEYKGAEEPVTIRCTKHGFVTDVLPKRVLRPNRLGGCPDCLSERMRARTGKQLKGVQYLFEQVEKAGKVDILTPREEIRNTAQKVLCRCKEHGREQLQDQSVLKRGGGLKCCTDAARERMNAQKNQEARERFYKLVAEYGRVELLGEFVDHQHKIKVRCLRHNEVHLVRPIDLLRCREGQPPGGGPICCNYFRDKLPLFLKGDVFATQPCKFYVADINGQFVKPGIARNPKHRSSHKYAKGFYSGLSFESPTLERAEAWTIEQILLKESIAAKPDELPEKYQAMAGRTELRLKSVFPASWFIKRFWELLEEMEERGWKDMAINL